MSGMAIMRSPMLRTDCTIPLSVSSIETSYCIIDVCIGMSPRCCAGAGAATSAAAKAIATSGVVELTTEPCG